MYIFAYRGEGAKHFDPILGCEGVRRVHGGEVGQASRGICRGPAQDMTQLWRVSINCVPCHQELSKNKKERSKSNQKLDIANISISA